MRWIGRRAEGPIRVVPGPHAAVVRADALTASTWQVGTRADRTGVRLDGAHIASDLAEVPSMGLPVGAVQVPPDGQPIIMLADRPVTGGYAVPAVVIGADIGRVARLRTGDDVSFASVSVEEAREALRQAWDELAALETLDVPEDDEPGWAGSHR
jgi:allophanate hydrolase subunit 2